MNGGFPESKILKQLIRDKIAPEKSLGHSDVKKEEEETLVKVVEKENDCVECKDTIQNSMDTDTTTIQSTTELPQVTVQYCSANDWLLRSAWASQEILTNFPNDVQCVSLKPDQTDTEGTFVSSYIYIYILTHTLFTSLFFGLYLRTYIHFG